VLNLLEWIAFFAVVFVGVPRLLLRAAQRLLHPGTRVDRSRRFSKADYRTIMNRAGWRCEHHGLLTGRCAARAELEADHVHPHSRGGQTDLANSQALCHRHNVAKGHKVPFWWNLLALQHRRAAYFTASADRRITRYGPRSNTRVNGKRKRANAARRRRWAR
jgi:hypothetical protein